jgi:hypothetical protein
VQLFNNFNKLKNEYGHSHPVPTFHLLSSVPKYPLKAFLPQEESTGLHIGANADTDFTNQRNLTISYILLNRK